jgi:GMP synthase-like glutamine amidotransferase
MRKILIALIVCGAVVAILEILQKPTERHKLNGVLVDLELKGPDPQRCEELREAIVRKLPFEAPSLRNIDISLDYVHFSDVGEDLLHSENVHFVVLSPQATPWHMYRGEAGVRLDALKALVRRLVFKAKKPVLGICGGHQFLVLAFGGTVDFIDPRLTDTFPERYPKEAISERGLIELETVRDDPIFTGVSTHPGRFLVMESHYEEVKVLPEPFVNLARSPMSHAQLIRIPGLLVYGTAFHPERGWKLSNGSQSEPAAGKQVLANFLAMVFEHEQSSRSNLE